MVAGTSPSSAARENMQDCANPGRGHLAYTQRPVNDFLDCLTRCNVMEPAGFEPAILLGLNNVQLPPRRFDADIGDIHPCHRYRDWDVGRIEA